MLIPTTRPPGLVAGGGGGAWEPTDEASLKMWIDASDTGTITESSGSVSQITDKSGNGNHASQSTGSQQPITGTRTINSLNALDFDGTDDVLEKTPHTFSGNSHHFVFIFEMDSYDSSRRFLRAGGTSRFSLGPSTAAGGSFYMDLFGTNNDSDGFVGDADSVPTIISMTFDDTTKDWRLYQDGNLLLTKTNGYETPFNNERVSLMASHDTVGTSATDGKFAEFMHFESNDDTIRQKAEGYGAYKWGLEANLPAGHPYKSSPP